MTLSDRQQKQLSQDLPREVVKILPRAGSPAYVSSHYVIERLNAVFGHDGWSFTHAAPTILAHGDRPVVHVAGTLTAASVTRADVGVGVAANGTPDALETALKAAVTDALKRCARTFGPSFGLALYDKEQSTVGYSFGAQEVLSLFANATTAADLSAAEAAARAAWPDLPAEERASVTQAQQRAQRCVASPSQAPSAPAPGARTPSFARTVARINSARSVETLVALVLTSQGRADERSEVLETAVGQVERIGTDAQTLRSRLDTASRLDVTRDQWEVAAEVLCEIDAAGDAAALDAVRKARALSVRALPDALLNAVKRVTTARATELGAPTVATRLLERAAAAHDADTLQKVYADLTDAASTARVTASQAQQITDAINARAAEIERQAA